MCALLPVHAQHLQYSCFIIKISFRHLKLQHTSACNTMVYLVCVSRVICKKKNANANARPDKVQRIGRQHAFKCFLSYSSNDRGFVCLFLRSRFTRRRACAWLVSWLVSMQVVHYGPIIALTLIAGITLTTIRAHTRLFDLFSPVGMISLSEWHSHDSSAVLALHSVPQAETTDCPARWCTCVCVCGLGGGGGGGLALAMHIMCHCGPVCVLSRSVTPLLLLANEPSSTRELMRADV